MVQDLHVSAPRIETQAFRHELVGFVAVIAMPVAEMLLGFPVGEEPEFGGFLARRKHLEAQESGRVFDQVRPVDEGVPHISLHSVDYGETTKYGDHFSPR
jgi:hypothetical protein